MKTDIPISLGRIRAKLATLRQLDTAFAIFGANSHRYQLGPVLTDLELAEHQSRLGSKLPDEYRQFVMTIGNGGAGPFYGLFPLNGGDPEDITDPKQIRKPFRWTEALNPNEWENPSAQEDILFDEDVDEGEDSPVYLNIPGVLYICHYGCASRFFLIVNGQDIGEVWMDRQADAEGLAPECDTDGQRLHFLDWYEKWLDEGIAAIHA